MRVRTGWLLAGALMVGTVACTNSASTAGPPSTPGPSATAAPRTSVVPSTTGTDGTGGEADDARARELVANADSSTGQNFTKDEQLCMVKFAITNPRMLKIDYDIEPLPPGDAELTFKMFSACLTKERFVDLLMTDVEKDQELNPEQVSCIRSVFMKLPPEDLVGMTVDDSPIQQRLKLDMGRCVLSGAAK